MSKPPPYVLFCILHYAFCISTSEGMSIRPRPTFHFTFQREQVRPA